MDDIDEHEKMFIIFCIVCYFLLDSSQCGGQSTTITTVMVTLTSGGSVCPSTQPQPPCECPATENSGSG